MLNIRLIQSAVNSGGAVRCRRSLLSHAFSASVARPLDSNLQLLSEVITSTEEKDMIAFLKPILSRKRYEGT